MEKILTMRAALIGGEKSDSEFLIQTVNDNLSLAYFSDHLEYISQRIGAVENVQDDIYFIRDDKLTKIELFGFIEHLKQANPRSSIVLISDCDDKYLLEAIKNRGVDELLAKQDFQIKPIFRIIENFKYKNKILKEIGSIKRKLLAVEKAAGTGIWEWNLCDNSFIWSEEQCRLFGMDPKENIPIEYDTWRLLIHPNDITSVEADLTRAIVGKDNFNRRFRIFDEINSTQTNRAFRWIHSIGLVERSENGAATKMIGVSFDVTDRTTSCSGTSEQTKAIARVATVDGMSLNASINNLPDCLAQFVLTSDGNFLFEDLNKAQAELIGLNVNEIVGRNPLEIFGSDTGTIVEKNLFAVLQLKQEVRSEVIFKLENAVRVYDTIFSPVFSFDNSIYRVTSCARDITAFHRSIHSHEHTQKMELIGLISCGIAHDFTNVLQNFISCCNLLESHVSSETAKKILKTAAKSVGHGKALCSQLMEFSRPKVAYVDKICINECIEGLSEIFTNMLGPGILIEKVLSSNIWQVKADRQKLEIAILNLVINSRDAMSEGGFLKIKTENIDIKESHTRPVGKFVRISVIDSGCGMTEDTLSRAATAFFTTKPVGRGTGLGLPMVKSSINSMGGSLQIKSKLGFGTCVILDLPVFPT